MVTVENYEKRKNLSGEEFYVLIISGGIQMVLSKESGRFYATMKQATVSCTFDEKTCKSLIGTKMPGSVHRVKCDPYQYMVKDTGELLNLEHRWEYTKEETAIESGVHEGKTMDVA